MSAFDHTNNRKKKKLRKKKRGEKINKINLKNTVTIKMQLLHTAKYGGIFFFFFSFLEQILSTDTDEHREKGDGGGMG